MNRSIVATRLPVNRFCFTFILTFFAIISLFPFSLIAQTTDPALPQVFLDTTYAPPSGTIRQPADGPAFQQALIDAQPGDIIELAAGATYTGNFTLPNKTTGTGWIYIQSSAIANLPPPGTRVSPNNAISMPKIVSPVIVDPVTQVQTPQGPAIVTASAAHHYRFVGVEITTTFSQRGATVFNLAELGSGQETIESDLPTDIVFDRSYLHGTSTGNVRRGIFMGSKRTAVIDSYLSDFHEVGQDSQAILPCTGPGPFKIVNNYLEGAGENLMFGGCDPRIAGLVPSDIEIRRNHFFKPLTWRVGDPSYAGIPWTVKNIFELKNAERVLVDGNIFEDNWTGQSDQPGFAIVFTPRNQDGNCTWCVVQDVTFTNNIVRHTAAGVSILGSDGINASQQAKRILIKNNLFDDVDGVAWAPPLQPTYGWLFSMLGGGTNPSTPVGAEDVQIVHNTGFNTRPPLNETKIIHAGPPGTTHTGFVYRDNITPHNQYGVLGDNQGIGNPTLDTYFPGALFTRNVMQGGPQSSPSDPAPYPCKVDENGPPPDPFTYPADNFCPPTWDEVKFVDKDGVDPENYRLCADESACPGRGRSPYKDAGTDGKDIGADIDRIDAAINGTIALTEGLVGYWRFDDGTGTVAKDSTSNGNNGTLLGGPTWITAGRIDGALSFDGNDDLVSIPNSPSWSRSSTQYTVAFWLKVKSIGDYKAAIAMGNWGPGPLFVFRDPSSGWAYGIQTAGGPNNWTCAGISPPLSYLTTVDNTFHHVAVVLDAPASRCDLYSDGQLIHTDLFVDGQTSFGTDPLYIGGFGDFDRLHSEIDDVRLYNRALSAAEVQQLSSMGGP